MYMNIQLELQFSGLLNWIITSFFNLIYKSCVLRKGPEYDLNQLVPIRGRTNEAQVSDY